MNAYTLIYPLCFYVSSILISPAFSRMEYPIARSSALLCLALLSFVIGYLLPFKIAFGVSFFLLLSLSLPKFREFRIERSELIFASVFAFFVLLRFIDPTILDAEKFMDSAFMNAVLKAESFPPNDPFFAGKKLDCYYYFGHVLAACVTLMSFAPPEVGYNIAVAAIPAYSALILFHICSSLRGVALTLFSGDPYSVVDLMRRLLQHKPIDGGYYWNATRVIPDTINEFPYFSFIHADLHAHVAAIPLKLIVIAALLERRYALLAASLFATFATNSWDYPIVLLLAVLFAAIGRDKKLIAASLASLIPAAALYAGMDVAAASLKLVTQRTNIADFLLYAAFPLAAAYAVVPKRKFLLYSLPAAMAAYFASPVLLVLLPLLVAALAGVREDAKLSLLAVGCVAFAAPDFVAVESRMNTVFKFYLAAWILIGTYVALRLNEVEGVAKRIVAAVLALALIYPIVATPVRYHEFEMTLDGMNFVRGYGEYEAIKWLQTRDGIVIEEGCSKVLCAYHYGGRVAAFTGNPAVIAWTNHEYVWRRNIREIVERSEDVRRFYTAKSCEEMWRIVKKYNVSYVFVGYEERRVFNATPERFERCFVKAFEAGNAAVFAKNLSIKN